MLEEKIQRIAEVLLSSIPPFQLMLGKLLGTVAVALTTASLYLLGAYFALKRTGYVQYFPSDQVSWFIAFLALAVLMFGSIFIAIGASVTDMKEAQSMMGPIMLLLVSPMFVWFNVVREPNSTMALVIQPDPPLTPMLMIVAANRAARRSRLAAPLRYCAGSGRNADLRFCRRPDLSRRHSHARQRCEIVGDGALGLPWLGSGPDHERPIRQAFRVF